MFAAGGLPAALRSAAAALASSTRAAFATEALRVAVAATVPLSRSTLRSAAYKQGVYDDAIRVKRNTFVLFLVNLFGGLAPGAVRHMYTLAQRARRLDRTLYPPRGATKYLPYWTQLLSAAIVTADTRRCNRRLGGLQVQASGRPPCGPPGRRRTP